MKLLCVLAMACVLAGASLTLPRVAASNTFPDCPFTLDTSTTPHTITWSIAENPNGVSSGPGTTEGPVSCDIQNISKTLSFDLTQPGTGTGPTAIASDYVDLVEIGIESSTTITLTSDPEGSPESPLTRRTQFGAAEEKPGGNSFFLGTDDLGRTVNYTVTSDLDPVPEPSTGMLLGTGLPAALGLWRFRPRRSQA